VLSKPYSEAHPNERDGLLWRCILAVRLRFEQRLIVFQPGSITMVEQN